MIKIISQRWFYPILFLAGLYNFAPLAGRAAQPGTGAMVSSNRWLIVLDTSFSMRNCAQGVKDAVAGLLNTGMNGQMWRGDTLGIWTFNEHLYTGRFALQEWSPETEATVFQNTLAFVARQPYEKNANMAEMISAVNQVIADSDVITIILVCNSDQPLSGTPFDQGINAIYQQNYETQKKARMPFITVLRAAGGKLISYKVTMAPWPVEFPPMPPAKTNSPPVAIKTNAVRRAAAPPPPLILSGRKPSPPSNATQAPVANSSPPVTASPAAETGNNLRGASSTSRSEAILQMQTQTAAAPQENRTATSPSKPAEPASAQTTVQSSPEPSGSAPAAKQVASDQRPMSASLTNTAKGPMETAPPAPPEAVVGHPISWIIAVLLAAMVSGIVFLLLRRRASPPSLITRLLDDENK